MKQFRITLTQEELTALSGLMDAGVKHLGLKGAVAAAVLIQRVEAAEVVETEENK